MIRPLALALPMCLALSAQAADAPPFLTTMPPGLTRLSDMIGTDVIGSDINRLGEVKDVLVDRSGRIGAVLIGAGGVLGIGEKDVAVPYGALLWNYDVGPKDSPRSSNTGAEPADGGAAQAKSAAATPPGPEAAQATGTVGDPAKPAEGLRPQDSTVPVTGSGKPVHAVLRGVTREEIRSAPAFGR